MVLSLTNHQGNTNPKPQWDITSNLLGCLLPKGEETANAGKDREKRLASCPVGGHVNWCSHYGKQYEDSSRNFYRELPYETVTLEKTLESPLDRKEIKPVNPKGHATLNIHWRDWCWSWNSNTLATWCEESTHWKRPWCQDRLKAGGERGNRGWDGWLASTQWTWVWANSRRQRSLACYSPWVHKELDMTERLNNSNNHMIQKSHYACVLILDIRNQYPKEMKVTKGNERSTLKRYLYSHIHCNIIYNSQGMETT